MDDFSEDEDQQFFDHINEDSDDEGVGRPMAPPSPPLQNNQSRCPVDLNFDHYHTTLINTILFSSNIMYNHQQLHSRLAWPSMKKHNVFEQSKNRTSEIILTTEQFTLTREG